MPFFARFDPAATWLTDLEPVFAPGSPEPAPYGVRPRRAAQALPQNDELAS